MKISFAITTCKEEPYTTNLITHLLRFIETAKSISPHEYEIVILVDYNTVPLSFPWPQKWIDDGIEICYRGLNNDFATHKNFLNERCSGDWILQLDADETINETFLFNFPVIIESNPEIEAFWLPRVNIVDGLTLDHVRKWNWILTTLPEFTAGKMLDPTSEEYRLLKEYDYIINEENGVVSYYQPIICWPDYQMRLYKRSPDIKWEGNVHEQLVGYKHYTRFPPDVSYAIEHHKDIKRQEQQNSRYETIKR